MVEVGETMSVEITRITNNDKGAGFSSDGKLILVAGVREDDEVVNIRVTKIGERIIEGTKIDGLRKHYATQSKAVESPYELDDEDEDEEDY